MIEKIILKKSAVLDKMPAAEQLDYGEIALNYNAEHPFLSFKDSDGDIMTLNDYSQDIAYLFSHKLDAGVLDVINENSDNIKKKLNITDFNAFKADNTKTINALRTDITTNSNEIANRLTLTDFNTFKADNTKTINALHNNMLQNATEIQDVNGVVQQHSTKLDTINATIAKKADIATLSAYAKKTDIPPEEIFVGNSAAAPSTAKIAIDFDSDIMEIQQTTGDSTTNVMSQKAVTDALNSIIARMEKLEKE